MKNENDEQNYHYCAVVACVQKKFVKSVVVKVDEHAWQTNKNE